MKKILYIFAIALIMSSCSFFAPNTSKALTEKEQLEESKKQTEQMELQTKALQNIATELHEISNKP